MILFLFNFIYTYRVYIWFKSWIDIKYGYMVPSNIEILIFFLILYLPGSSLIIRNKVKD